MIIRIITVGKLRDKYLQDAVADYVKRLRIYGRLEIVEISEAQISEAAASARERNSLEQEANSILQTLESHESIVVVLDRRGNAFDSLELAAWLEERLLEGQNEITWVIGGSLGLANSVLTKADLVLSFSRMTFPHRMMRLILLEQIYRSIKIIRHEPYHK